MAITAAMTIDSATGAPGQMRTATCTVTNSGGSSVNVTAAKGYASPDGTTPTSTAVAIGEIALGPGMTVAVAGSNGTLALTFGVTPFAPSSGAGWQNPSSYVYDIGCVVYTSDGSVTEATVTDLTITAPTWLG